MFFPATLCARNISKAVSIALISFSFVMLLINLIAFVVRLSAETKGRGVYMTYNNITTILGGGYLLINCFHDFFSDVTFVVRSNDYNKSVCSAAAVIQYVCILVVPFCGLLHLFSILRGLTKITERSLLSN